MTEGIILQVEALGRAQKQPDMHDGPIVTRRNGDPIAPIVVSDADADAADNDLVAPAQPLFLPLYLDAIKDVDVATNAPLRVLPADVGAENAPGAVDQGVVIQGALALADEEIEGVAYNPTNTNHAARHHLSPHTCNTATCPLHHCPKQTSHQQQRVKLASS